MQTVFYDCRHCEFETTLRGKIRDHVKESHKDLWDSGAMAEESLSEHYHRSRSIKRKPMKGLTNPNHKTRQKGPAGSLER